MSKKPKAQAYLVQFLCENKKQIERMEFVGHEYDAYARIQRHMKANENIRQAVVFNPNEPEPIAFFSYKGDL